MRKLPVNLTSSTRLQRSSVSSVRGTRSAPRASAALFTRISMRLNSANASDVRRISDLLVAAGEQEDLRPFFAPRERGRALGFSAIPMSQNGQNGHVLGHDYEFALNFSSGSADLLVVVCISHKVDRRGSSPPGSSRRAGGYSPVLRLTADEMSLPFIPLSQKVHLLGHDSTAEGDILGQGSAPARSRTLQGRFPPARLLHPGGRKGSGEGPAGGGTFWVGVPRRPARGRSKAVFLLLACCTQEEDAGPAKGAPASVPVTPNYGNPRSRKCQLPLINYKETNDPEVPISWL